MDDISNYFNIPQIIQFLSFIAATGGMLGAYLNANLKISGWTFWLIGNTLWIIIGFYYENYWMMIQFCTYDILNIIGLITWTKKINKKGDLL